MATLNSYGTAKKLAIVLLLVVVLLSKATSPAKAQSGDPLQCFIDCDTTLIQCAVKCVKVPGNVTCYTACGQAIVKCIQKCLPKNKTIDGNPSVQLPPTIKVPGRLEQADVEMETVKAVAMISSSSAGGNSIKGSLQFLRESTGGRTHIKGIIVGLSPGLHGLHIEFVSSCSSMNGPHFNPENKENRSQSAEMHHAYCLGNVIANQNGIAHAEISIEGKDMPPNGLPSVLGGAVIVHADAMVGCGIIEHS